MTREDIIAMALEAGVSIRGNWDEIVLERFAALVAAKERDKWMERVHILILGEREGCAKVCDEVLGVNNVSAAIRARGETK